MENYLPYIVSVVCALISGFASYAVARKQSREDIKKLDMMNTLISEAMKMPEVKRQISQGMNTAGNKRR